VIATRAQVVECAREYLGTRWHHQGRVKGVGVDCAGLLICVARELGLADVHVHNYSPHPDGTLEMVCAEHMQQINPREALPGDVLAFTFVNLPQHLGIVASQAGVLTIIHSYAEAKKVVENSIDPVWRPLIRGAYRIPGVE
jgi:cell wall-associated NlpC family hydrolase